MVKIFLNIISVIILISCNYNDLPVDNTIKTPIFETPIKKFTEIRGLVADNNIVYLLLQRFDPEGEYFINRAIISYDIVKDTFRVYHLFSKEESINLETKSSYQFDNYILKSNIKNVIFNNGSLNLIGANSRFIISNKVEEIQDNINFKEHYLYNNVYPYNAIRYGLNNKIYKLFVSSNDVGAIGVSEMGKSSTVFEIYYSRYEEGYSYRSNGFKFLISHNSRVQVLEDKSYLYKNYTSVFKLKDTIIENEIFYLNSNSEVTDLLVDFTLHNQNIYLNTTGGIVYKYNNNTFVKDFSFSKKDLSLTNLHFTKFGDVIGLYNTGSRIGEKLDSKTKEIISVLRNNSERIYEFETDSYVQYNYYTNDIRYNTRDYNVYGNLLAPKPFVPIPTAEDENGNVFIGGQAFRIYNGSTLKSFPLDSIIKVLGLGW